MDAFVYIICMIVNSLHHLHDVNRLYPSARQAIIIQRARRPFRIKSIMHIPMPIQNRIKPISRFTKHHLPIRKKPV